MADFALNHVPFGLRERDQAIVDVYAVHRGRACGCICPSCRTPLIARHGEEKAWHFAHASRNVYDRTVQECDFSFYVSVRLMARQLIGSKLTLALPEYRDRVSQYVDVLHETRELDYVITKGKAIQLEQVEVETRFAKAAVDLKGRVGDFEFVVYLVHPGRLVPPELEALDGIKAGVIAIDLRNLAGVFAQLTGGERTYSDALADFLGNDLASKRWVYHPRRAALHKDAEGKLEQSIAREIEDPRRYSGLGSGLPTDKGHLVGASQIIAAREVKCECLFCGQRWDGREPGVNECPRCRTHLGTRILPSGLRFE